jgi:plastocyanin
VQRLWILVFVVFALAVAGCGGGEKKQQGAPSSGKTIQIKETDFKLAPAKVTIASTGSVTFEATNDGQVDHALEIEGNGVEEESGTISPGSSGKVTVDLSKAGTYEMYCPIDDHRGMGMEATVVVGGAAGGGGGNDDMTTDETKTKSSGGYGY